MTSAPWSTAASMSALVLLAGCGAAGGGSPAARPSSTAAMPSATALEIPDVRAEGPPREVQVLIDVPAVKIVAIVLRDGTLLPEHTAPVAVTIEAASGAGTVRALDAEYRVDVRHAVTLAPGVAHSVAPDSGTDLVLLVHHHRGGAQ